jgi:hypothetical protein
MGRERSALEALSKMSISQSLRAGVAAATLACLLGAGSASAETWDQAHPRRAEVNHRLNMQNRRINRERREGEISQSEAHKLHVQDRRVRNEERFMASQNGGHITRQERRALNQQENGISKEIGH